MKFVVLGRALGKDGPYPRIRGIDLYHELELGVWVGGCGEQMLQSGECSLSLRSPGEGDEVDMSWVRGAASLL